MYFTYAIWKRTSLFKGENTDKYLNLSKNKNLFYEIALLFSFDDHKCYVIVLRSISCVA